MRRGTLLWGGILSVLLGCDMPDRHDIAFLRRPAVWEVESKSSKSPQPDSHLSSLTAPKSEKDWGDQQWQSWYLHHIDPVGYVGSVMMQSQVIPDELGSDSPTIKVTLKERLLVHPTTPLPPSNEKPSNENTPENKRGDEALNQRWPNVTYFLTANEQTFIHAADGNLLKVECTARRGFSQTRKTISVSNNQVAIDTQGPLGPTKKTIRHSGPLNGPLHVYRSIAANPLAKRELRQATVLLPIHEQIASLRLQGNLQALAKRLTPEGISSDSLNEAIGLITVGEQPHRVRYYWYDDDGLIQTTHIAGERQFTYRCDQSLYEQANEQSRQLSHPIVVEVPGESISSQATPDKLGGLAFDVQMLTPNSATTPWLQPAPRQYTQSIGEHSQRIITSVNPIPPSRLAGRYESMTNASNQTDLVATKLIDYRSPALRGVLATIRPIRNLPKNELAQEINRTVHALLSFAPFAAGVQPASAISRSTQADSTEHAIMLISLLRANGIPARMALGLKHSTDDSTVDANRFVNHAWVVADVDGLWVALDPTTGKRTSAGCLTLEINDLSEIEAGRMVDHYLSLLRSFHIKIHRVIVAKT